MIYLFSEDGENGKRGIRFNDDDCIDRTTINHWSTTIFLRKP